MSTSNESHNITDWLVKALEKFQIKNYSAAELENFILEMLGDDDSIDMREKIRLANDIRQISSQMTKSTANVNCSYCEEMTLSIDYCEECMRNFLKKEWTSWTSGNKLLDQLIKDFQILHPTPYNVVEWIPYEKLTNIELMTINDAVSIYKADWPSGQWKIWNQKFQRHFRFIESGQPTAVTLKMYNDHEKFFDEETTTLEEIHKKGYMHKNLHSGNILTDGYQFVITGWSDQEFDDYRQIDICNGLRPEVILGTPAPYEKIMCQCWDADPSRRPTADKVSKIMLHMHRNYIKLEECLEGFEEPGFEILPPPKPHPMAFPFERIIERGYLPKPQNAAPNQNFHTRNSNIGIDHSTCMLDESSWIPPRPAAHDRPTLYLSDLVKENILRSSSKSNFQGSKEKEASLTLNSTTAQKFLKSKNEHFESNSTPLDLNNNGLLSEKDKPSDISNQLDKLDSEVVKSKIGISFRDSSNLLPDDSEISEIIIDLIMDEKKTNKTKDHKENDFKSTNHEANYSKFLEFKFKDPDLDFFIITNNQDGIEKLNFELEYPISKDKSDKNPFPMPPNSLDLLWNFLENEKTHDVDDDFIVETDQYIVKISCDSKQKNIMKIKADEYKALRLQTDTFLKLKKETYMLLGIYCEFSKCEQIFGIPKD
ncbi:4720_t:CDS:2 [Gigaspora margarita]|uniref:4720_t:CDS:1 n=1 Tax=Gigaspora margarita TaxID=4874 RepID=A0ABN7UP24_GIGMA|nr:4720_t:CDS:2 [Gigaspora margarita]